MPLFHTRTTKCTFQFIVDKIQNKLDGYDARLLSLAGRVMLAKSVLLTILRYFIQSAMLQIDICERTEQIVRRFVWGSTKNGAKVALVNWDSCCQPPAMGGIGLQ